MPDVSVDTWIHDLETVVDANGVVRSKGIGYDPTGKWEKGMSEAIEKYEPHRTASASNASRGR